MTSKATSKAMGQTKHPVKTFERQAGPMPTLKRAAPAPAVPAESRAEADQQAQPAVPGFLSQKEVLLRLVETLKSL
jgi:hypothetical protein